MSDHLPTADEIIDIHDEIAESYGLKYTGISAILPEQTLNSVLENVDEYDGVYLRGAALLRDLITAHVFEDGNKRTAWTVTRLYLQRHDAEPAVRETEEVAAVLRHIQRFDYDEIANWLATGEIDDDKLRS